MTVRVKICGLTRPDDAAAAASFGADAIGLVFVPGTPRAVDIDTARAVCAALPPFVTRVGLFMNADHDHVAHVLARVPLHGLQFHGGEPPAFCNAFRRPWVRVVPMAGGRGELPALEGAEALLLDGHAPGEAGGSGRRVDWHGLPECRVPWILAGGLDPGNVRRACRITRPHAVDVSSGVESSPGIKDHSRMKAFIEALRHGRDD